LKILKHFARQVRRRLLVRLGLILQKACGELAQSGLPAFANAPKNLTIKMPREIHNPQLMLVGDDVKVGPNSVLKAITRYPGDWMRHPQGAHIEQTFTPRIAIGHRVTATAGLHIAACREITIEDDVMFASNVLLVDSSHAYRNANTPYKYQGFFKLEPILIRRGAWIGQNVVVMPGVTIGELAIIGANSVVTHDIPDQCIAIGIPARVVKRWDSALSEWTRV
jgi:acetyltransferase-like isoleucine patch superfamily enzyme